MHNCISVKQTPNIKASINVYKNENDMHNTLNTSTSPTLWKEKISNHS